MAIRVVCSGCGSEATVPESAAGQRGRCRQCNAVVTVPASNRSDVACFMCGTDLSERERTKDAADNYFCVECWKLKIKRQKQAKAATATTTANPERVDDDYGLAPIPQRPAIRSALPLF